MAGSAGQGVARRATGRLGRSRGHGTPWGLVAGLLGIAALLALPGLPGGAAAGATGSGRAGPSGYVSNVSSWCPAQNFSPYSSFNLTLAPPSAPLAVGDHLAVDYEIEAYATTLAPPNVTVYVPTATAIFPQASGPAYRIVVPSRAIALPGTGWSSPSVTLQNRTVSAPVTFAGGSTAFLTSAKIAVMATADYGQLTVGLRWQWIVTRTASSRTSPWSVVGSTNRSKALFDPAPYIGLAGTSNRTVAIGASFTVDLTGAVHRTRFFSELENASHGLVVRSNFSYALAPNVSPFPASIVALGANGELQPGKMLDHVRNECMALVYSLPVTVVYAAQATVRFGVSTTGCGPIALNGTNHGGATAANLTPSTQALPLGVPGCAGHPFAGWTSSGGIDVASPSSAATTVRISASGSLRATFH